MYYASVWCRSSLDWSLKRQDTRGSSRSVLRACTRHSDPVNKAKVFNNTFRTRAPENRVIISIITVAALILRFARGKSASHVAVATRGYVETMSDDPCRQAWNNNNNNNSNYNMTRVWLVTVMRQTYACAILCYVTQVVRACTREWHRIGDNFNFTGAKQTHSTVCSSCDAYT